MRKLLTTVGLGLFVGLAFISCDEEDKKDDKNENPLIGTWKRDGSNEKKTLLLTIKSDHTLETDERGTDVTLKNGDVTTRIIYKITHNWKKEGNKLILTGIKVVTLKASDNSKYYEDDHDISDKTSSVTYSINGSKLTITEKLKNSDGKEITETLTYTKQ